MVRKAGQRRGMCHGSLSRPVIEPGGFKDNSDQRER